MRQGKYHYTRECLEDTESERRTRSKGRGETGAESCGLIEVDGDGDRYAIAVCYKRGKEVTDLGDVRRKKRDLGDDLDP